MPAIHRVVREYPLPMQFPGIHHTLTLLYMADQSYVVQETIGCKYSYKEFPAGAIAKAYCLRRVQQGRKQ